MPLEETHKAASMPNQSFEPELLLGEESDGLVGDEVLGAGGGRGGAPGPNSGRRELQSRHPHRVDPPLIILSTDRAGGADLGRQVETGGRAVIRGVERHVLAVEEK